MATTGQINREAIIRVEGEIKLLKQEKFNDENSFFIKHLCKILL